MKRDRDPDHLHPFALMKMRQLDRLAFKTGIGTLLEETWRDPVLQSADYAKGRDAHGNIIDRSQVVTNARGGQSDHNFTRMVADPGAPDGWREVPASLAWHFYILHPDGGLLGLGEHPLDAAAKEQYARLGALAATIDVRWGGDTDRDGKPFEPGEWDLVHFSARPRGYTVAQVAAMLRIRGGDLAWPRTTGRVA